METKAQAIINDAYSVFNSTIKLSIDFIATDEQEKAELRQIINSLIK